MQICKEWENTQRINCADVLQLILSILRLCSTNSQTHKHQLFDVYTVIKIHMLELFFLFAPMLWNLLVELKTLTGIK